MATTKLVFTVSVSDAASSVARNIVTKTATLDKQLQSVRDLITAYATQCQTDGVSKKIAGQYLAECFGATSVNSIADGVIAKAWKAACEKLSYTSGEPARKPRAPKLAASSNPEDKNEAIQAALKQDPEDVAGAFFGLRETEKMKLMLAMFSHMSTKEQAAFLAKAATVATVPEKKVA